MSCAIDPDNQMSGGDAPGFPVVLRKEGLWASSARGEKNGEPTRPYSCRSIESHVDFPPLWLRTSLDGTRAGSEYSGSGGTA